MSTTTTRTPVCARCGNKFPGVVCGKCGHSAVFDDPSLDGLFDEADRRERDARETSKAHRELAKRARRFPPAPKRRRKHGRR